MQRILYWAKRVVIFTGSLFTISWLTAFLFITLVGHFVDLNDTSYFQKLLASENMENLYFESFFADAVIAFLIMYLAGFSLLREYKGSTTKFITLCIVSYLILFVILAVFA